MLTVYVDDFKLAGPRAHLAEGWNLITGSLDVEEPGGLGLYLGCKHEKEQRTVNGKSVTVMTYNMEDYFAAIVKDYEELASEVMGKKVILKIVATPFLEDDHKSSPARKPCSYRPSTPMCPWCKFLVTLLQVMLLS